MKSPNPQIRKQITPEQLASSGTEDGEQLALFCWIALNINQYPDLKWLHHSPNGGSRHKAEAAKLKAMGVKSGFPDLILILKRGKFNGLCIELKRLKKGKVSDRQNEWGEYLKLQGFGFAVCNGWLEARDMLISYLEWKG